MTSRRDRPTFKRDKYFLDYQIVRLIGQGGFGDIYFVRERDTGAEYALKTEGINQPKHFLNGEAKILKNVQDSGLFPRFIKSGKTQNFNYLVMEILGPSLATIRHVMDDKKFSLSTTLRVGIEMLRLIEVFHNHGYIHRDVKPANFLIRPSRSQPLALIDYGLAKLYIDPKTNEHVEQREKTGFVGTAKYASLNSHECHDLGRVDDLYSWFFSLLEMLAGKLPWPSVKDREEVYEAKKNANLEDFCKPFPKQLYSLYRVISQYRFQDKPDYKLLMAFLVEAMKENNVSFNDSYDWEQLPKETVQKISVISLKPPKDDEPFQPTDLPPAKVPGDADESYSYSYSYSKLNEAQEREVQLQEVVEQPPPEKKEDKKKGKKGKKKSPRKNKKSKKGKNMENNDEEDDNVAKGGCAACNIS